MGKRAEVDSRNSLRLALSAAWKAGQLLIAEKKSVNRRMGRGAWMTWLEQNFNGSARTAQRYMCLAHSITDASFLRGLSLRQAYFRLGISTEPKARRETVSVSPLPETIRLATRLVEVLRARPANGYQEDLRPLFDQLRTMFEQANNLPETVSITSWPLRESDKHRKTKGSCVA